MEKETLEEMAQEYFENNIFCDGITEFEHSIAIRSYIAGAKLQAERMYSEEEVLVILESFNNGLSHEEQLSDEAILFHLEQFKKK